MGETRTAWLPAWRKSTICTQEAGAQAGRPAGTQSRCTQTAAALPNTASSGMCQKELLSTDPTGSLTPRNTSRVSTRFTQQRCQHTEYNLLLLLSLRGPC